MNINEVAQYLAVSHKTVRRYVKAGKLKVSYIDGRGVYDQIEVEALKADKETPVHRAIAVPENALQNENKIDETSEQFELSQYVLAELQLLQILEQRYNLQYIASKLTITIDEAALISGFSKAGLKTAIKSGTLKAIKHGNRWRLRLSDLEDYVQCLFGEVGHHQN